MLAEIYLPQVGFKYGVDGRILENATREYVRATKGKEFNQHELMHSSEIYWFRA